MGLVPPVPGFLEALRAACSRAGAILIFDEVITGFRLAPGGAQELFRVTPDVAVFGKAIGSGFQVAASADLMDLFVSKRVMHGGMYNAPPVAMAAPVATLDELASGQVYPFIE